MIQTEIPNNHADVTATALLWLLVNQLYVHKQHSLTHSTSLTHTMVFVCVFFLFSSSSSSFLLLTSLLVIDRFFRVFLFFSHFISICFVQCCGPQFVHCYLISFVYAISEYKFFFSFRTTFAFHIR